MDSLHRGNPELSPLDPSAVFGILYAEDFDDPAEDGPAEPASAQPAITQADVDAACAAAVRAARLDWQVAQDQMRITALSSIGTVLGGIRDASERSAVDVAEATVTTILSIVAGQLPHFCREHGPAEVRALLGRLLPTLRSQAKISVRVHPDLVAVLQKDMAGLEPDLAALVDIVAAPVERGDVKVNWENGAMARDSRQITQAIRDALNQLGLHLDVEAPAKRRMAYAD